MDLQLELIVNIVIPINKTYHDVTQVQINLNESKTTFSCLITFFTIYFLLSHFSYFLVLYIICLQIFFVAIHLTSNHY